MKIPRLKRSYKINNLGYSLTEILIVVGLLTLIAGVGIPRYGEAIRKNREKTAITNLQALRSAGLVYRSEMGTFWDTADVWEADLATINATLGTNITNIGTPVIIYSYIYEFGGDGNLTHAVRASWVENGNTSTIEIRETNQRVVTGPCCSSGNCAHSVALLPACV